MMSLSPVAGSAKPHRPKPFGAAGKSLLPLLSFPAFLALLAGTAGAQRLDRLERLRQEPRPAIYRSADGHWRLDLPPAMEDALDRYNRDFEPWADYYALGADAYGDAQDPDEGYDGHGRRVYERAEGAAAPGRQFGYPRYSSRATPWAVIGDFNGDGRTDLALAGRDDRDLLVIFVLSTGRRGYRAVTADREPYDPEDPRASPPPPRLGYLYPGRYVVDDPRLYYPREILVDRPAVQLTARDRPGAILLTAQGTRITPYYLSDRPAPPAWGSRRP